MSLRFFTRRIVLIAATTGGNLLVGCPCKQRAVENRRTQHLLEGRRNIPRRTVRLSPGTRPTVGTLLIVRRWQELGRARKDPPLRVLYRPPESKTPSPGSCCGWCSHALAYQTRCLPFSAGFTPVPRRHARSLAH